LWNAKTSSALWTKTTFPRQLDLDIEGLLTNVTSESNAHGGEARAIKEEMRKDNLTYPP